VACVIIVRTAFFLSSRWSERRATKHRRRNVSVLARNTLFSCVVLILAGTGCGAPSQSALGRVGDDRVLILDLVRAANDTALAVLRDGAFYVVCSLDFDKKEARVLTTIPASAIPRGTPELVPGTDPRHPVWRQSYRLPWHKRLQHLLSPSTDRQGICYVGLSSDPEHHDRVIPDIGHFRPRYAVIASVENCGVLLASGPTVWDTWGYSLLDGRDFRLAAQLPVTATAVPDRGWGPDLHPVSMVSVETKSEGTVVVVCEDLLRVDRTGLRILSVTPLRELFYMEITADWIDLAPTETPDCFVAHELVEGGNNCFVRRYTFYKDEDGLFLKARTLAEKPCEWPWVWRANREFYVASDGVLHVWEYEDDRRVRDALADLGPSSGSFLIVDVNGEQVSTARCGGFVISKWSVDFPSLRSDGWYTLRPAADTTYRYLMEKSEQMPAD
jgi:hypothetical protein